MKQQENSDAYQNELEFLSSECTFLTEQKECKRTQAKIIALLRKLMSELSKRK